MDTKSKASNGFFHFLVFFLSFSLLLSALCLPAMFRKGFFQPNFYHSGQFESHISSIFGNLCDLSEAENEENDFPFSKADLQMQLSRYGSNLIYYVRSYDSDQKEKIYTNCSVSDPDEFKSIANSVDYGYFVYFSSTGIQAMENHIPAALPPDSVYWALDHGALADSDFPPLISFAVKSNLEPYGTLWSAAFSWQIRQILSAAYLFFWFAALVVLIFLLFRRSLLVPFHHRIAQLMSYLLVEIKLIALIAAAAFGVAMASGCHYDTFYFILFLPCFWWCYLCVCDIVINKARFGLRNMLSLFQNLYRRFIVRYPFQKKALGRGLLYLAGQILCVLLALLFYGRRMPAAAFFFFFLFLLFCIFGFLDFFRQARLFGDLMDYTKKIRLGEEGEPPALKPHSDFYGFAQDLNSIHTGIEQAVEQQVKSEKMKVELITNVSHDLKTPLTSIISYVDLLKKETLTPDYANDYVRILEQKSSRLATLVQDLFDIAKANSGNIDVHLEKLNLVEHINQTLAELSELIDRSGLDFRVNLPPEKVCILADGQKLYRVLENLISNAVKYSMPGTRVYIDLFAVDGKVTVSIKNIAKSEIHFTAEEIRQRFTRGDPSRTGEGSGLGLAIVDSFTSIQNGSFDIFLDGDLFKAVLTFSQLPE